MMRIRTIPRKIAGRVVDRLADRRFETALAHDRAGPMLLLSPHLDDAVLNCWSLLTSDAGLDVVVVNVFAGLPPAGLLTPWDRVCGASGSRAHVRERHAEDVAALGLAGRTPTNLPLLEGQYRDGRRPSRAQIDRLVAAVVPATSLLCAPLGVVHEDHALVRRYATAVAARARIPLRLYADVPYTTRFGWPHWVTEDTPDPRLDVDAHFAVLLDGVKEIADHRSARVVRLPAADAAAKLTALRTYATQISGLDGGRLRMVTSPAVHPFEVFWDARAP